MKRRNFFASLTAPLVSEISASPRDTVPIALEPRGSFLYPAGELAILSGELNLETDRIVAALCSDLYRPSRSHQWLRQVPPQAVIATAALTNKTFTEGVFDADDLTFERVVGKEPLTQVILYGDTDPNYCRLICRIVNGLVKPNAGNIVISWSNFREKIFTLA